VVVVGQATGMLTRGREVKPRIILARNERTVVIESESSVDGPDSDRGGARLGMWFGR
jgi:hypothetical protein